MRFSVGGSEMAQQLMHKEINFIFCAGTPLCATIAAAASVGVCNSHLLTLRMDKVLKLCTWKWKRAILIQF